MKYNDRIKELRKLNEWTQSQLAEKLNVTKATISKYESGSLDISTETIEKLSAIFGVTAGYLMGDESESIVIEKNNYGEKYGLTDDEIRYALEIAKKIKNKS